jgi:ketosteroid isomerase-like protein
MNPNQTRIEKFYTAFSQHDAAAMADCYHADIQFQDPVFGKLKGNEVAKMWKMLLERSKGDLKIEFSNVDANSESGAAKWIATYHFSKTNRKVVNVITAEFEFRDGLISKHTDTFDLWKWSRQAFGFKGLLLGWTGFMQRKISEQAKRSLANYITI